MRPSGASDHPNDLDDEDDYSSPLLLVYIMNRGLPERFLMSATDIDFAIMRHERKTKRELLKETHCAWAAIGRPKPRGWTLPPCPQMRAKLEYAIPAFVDLYQQVASGKLVSEHDIADRIRVIVRRPGRLVSCERAIEQARWLTHPCLDIQPRAPASTR